MCQCVTTNKKRIQKVKKNWIKQKKKKRIQVDEELTLMRPLSRDSSSQQLIGRWSSVSWGLCSINLTIATFKTTKQFNFIIIIIIIKNKRFYDLFNTIFLIIVSTVLISLIISAHANDEYIFFKNSMNK